MQTKPKLIVLNIKDIKQNDIIKSYRNKGFRDYFQNHTYSAEYTPEGLYNYKHILFKDFYVVSNTYTSNEYVIKFRNIKNAEEEKELNFSLTAKFKLWRY